MRCTPAVPAHPPSNGHAFNMYWWYHIVHVQQTLNYTNLTTAPKCKKPNLNLCMCAGVGAWVLLKSPFCVKHPIFTNISWDFDDLSTKTRHAPYNVWSSKHPPAGCTLDGKCHCHRSKRYPPFESGLPPPLGITKVPGVYFFPLLLCVGKFFFHPSRTSFFFPPMWVKFFFPSMCGSSFFFFSYLWVGQVFFFFYKNFLRPPPLEV